jgi:hypothetical protein
MLKSVSRGTQHAAQVKFQTFSWNRVTTTAVHAATVLCDEIIF